MKYFSDTWAELWYEDSMWPSIEALHALLYEGPLILKPVKDADKDAEAAFAAHGFRLYPTVLRTTLFYDERSDCFFKMLHPIGIKKMILFAFTGTAHRIFRLSRQLSEQGITVPEVTAYGRIRDGNIPLFAMRRAQGRSLYDLLIKEGKTLPADLCLTVIAAVTRFHRAGFWFGDAHLSHIFTDGFAVTGFIDIDSIRRNWRKGLRNYAKDLAGLNHPRLPLTGDKKQELLYHYVKTMGIPDAEDFLEAVTYYSERRWKRQT